eukprot:GILJ01002172.1.p1 GENE.GILJ01002172.1~~GILJ01002172.1.p1  ORF type:complete len:372 (+),score=71.11 GILJ01002172.1:64-1116(+)
MLARVARILAPTSRAVSVVSNQSQFLCISRAATLQRQTFSTTDTKAPRVVSREERQQKTREARDFFTTQSATTLWEKLKARAAASDDVPKHWLLAILDQIKSPEESHLVPLLLDFFRRRVTYTQHIADSAVKALIRAGQPKDASMLLMNSKTLHLFPSVGGLNNLMEALAKDKHPEEIAKLSSYLQNNKMYANYNRVLNVAIRAYLTVDDLPSALKLFESSPQSVDIVVYNTLTAHYITKGDMEAAKRMLEEARESKLRPNRATRRLEMLLKFKEGDVDAVIELFKKVAADETYRSKDWHCDVITFLKQVSTGTEAQIQEAQKLLQDIKTNKPALWNEDMAVLVHDILKR